MYSPKYPKLYSAANDETNKLMFNVNLRLELFYTAGCENF